MDGGTVFLTLASFLGLPAVEAAALSSAGRQGLRGVHKHLWCDGMQRMVDVDFMEVNPDRYDVASCTVFSVDDCIACDKRCVKVMRKAARLTA
jgi:hypothetical protein